MPGVDRQIIGMRGVYLVAAELSRLDFIVAPTSRGARGADLLITDRDCNHAFSIQVKTTRSGFFLFGKHMKKMKSKDYVYVLVHERKKARDFYVVKSPVAARMATPTWNGGFQLKLAQLQKFKDKWASLN
ncbi:MAG TPA: hypothetical protein VMH86_00050 [Rhizomicrobium sp.]|nr:hypothetical protein [Rhizomicrobium sp.]